MIIAKPEWFQRRKYSGWGVTPKDWRGWTYIIVILILIFGFQALPFWSNTTRIVITILFFIFLLIDHLDVMFQIKRDEREILHEAKSERNAMWVMITILAAGLAYQVAVTSITQTLQIDWFVVAAIIAALITKAISNYYYGKKE